MTARRARPHTLARPLAVGAGLAGIAACLMSATLGAPAVLLWAGAGLAALALIGLGFGTTLLAPKTDPDLEYLSLAQSSEAYIRLGRDGRIAFATPAVEDLLGAGPAALKGQSLAAFAAGPSRADVQGALARTSYFGATTKAQFRVRCGEGGYRWVEMRCRPLFALGSAPGSAAARAAAFEMVAGLRDITAQKKAEAALRAQRDEAMAASQAKSWFLASMSHELRTPLNAIIGFSEMMTAEMFGPLGHSRYKEYSGHIKESGEHLRDLINDVLDVSKIEAGRFALELEQVSVPMLLDETLKAVSVSAKRRKVRLDVDFPTGLPRVRADHRALKQMLLNLLANAIKFTPEKGRVTAAARAEGTHMVIEVRDTGVGMSENAIARVGRAFEQAPGGRLKGHDEKADKGTGLGLALVKTFAEVHGGTLEVESTKGRGTCARVRLPLEGPGGQGGDKGPAEAIDIQSRRVA